MGLSDWHWGNQKYLMKESAHIGLDSCVHTPFSYSSILYLAWVIRWVLSSGETKLVLNVPKQVLNDSKPTSTDQHRGKAFLKVVENQSGQTPSCNQWPLRDLKSFKGGVRGKSSLNVILKLFS